MDLLTVLRSLGSVAVILLLVGAGVFVERRRWFPGDSWKGLGSIVVNIAMPCSAFYYLTSGFTRGTLADAGYGMLVYAGVLILSWAVSLLLAKFIKVPVARVGVFAATAAFSNTVFIGVPMTEMLFGADAVKYAFMAFLPNMTLFWTFGFAGIRRDAEPQGPLFAHGWAMKLLNPTLIATVIALLFILFNVQPPPILQQAAKTMGGLVSPAALLYCGMLLSAMGLKNLRVNRSHIALMLVRFVVSPLMAAAALLLLPLPDMMTRVLIAQAAMPAMSQISNSYIYRILKCDIIEYSKNPNNIKNYSRRVRPCLRLKGSMWKNGRVSTARQMLCCTTWCTRWAFPDWSACASYCAMT